MKLGLESFSLSGAFLETLPCIFILFHFYLNFTEHILELLLQLKLEKTAKLFKNKSCPPRVKRFVTLTINYKLYRISDNLLISEQ